MTRLGLFGFGTWLGPRSIGGMALADVAVAVALAEGIGFNFQPSDRSPNK